MVLSMFILVVRYNCVNINTGLYIVFILPDINECLGNHGCSQDCANNVGSYICYCRDGFKLDITDRKTCIGK